MATGNPKATWTTQLPHMSEDRDPGAEVTLNYAGKAPRNAILETAPNDMLPLWEPTHPAPNRLYYGDNLPLLAALLRDPTVKGHVRLIYIDPPFSTNSVFQSRTHEDAYQDVLTGSAFIEFIRRRLILLNELLAEDGSIYVHLDENMAFYIKIIMDEVFGGQNFRNWITRRKCSHKNYTKKKYGNISDYILFYTKSDQYVWNRPVESWTPERAAKEYTHKEESTGRRYKNVPIHAPGTRNGETGQPWRGKLPPSGKHWQYAPKTLDEMDARGEIYWSPSGNPRRKIYLENSVGIPIQDIWYDFRDTRNQNIQTTGYPTEKHPGLLDRIIQASSHPGDLVLDCFSGSGTTLAVADFRGRTWIGIDQSPAAITSTLRRFRQGTQRMSDFVDGDRALNHNAHPPEQQLSLFTDEQCSNLHDHRVANFALYAPSDTDQTYVAMWQHLL